MSEKKKILIVDDEENILLLLRDNLIFEGYDVSEARDGMEALDKVDEVKPDLILLDIGLPKLDGWGVCQRLKNNPNTKDIPLIILSARAQDEDVQRGQQYGANGYLRKPCNPREFINKIKENLQ
ncbi:MAG: response regulator [bacterium]